MAKRNQKGAQRHAEGEHGPRTHGRLIEQLESGPRGERQTERLAGERVSAAWAGKRRLVEDRQQHDEAEKNSERRQLFVEHSQGRDVGPSDNSGSLHGVLGHRKSRSDYRKRNRKGQR